MIGVNLMADNKKEYAVGDEVTVSGVVTRVGDNGGNPEYTVAVNNENSERPISVPPRVHPAAFTVGPVELAEENQKTYDEIAKDAAEADKALEEDNKDEAGSDSNPETIREKTVTPDPAKTPAGQGAKGTLPKSTSTK
jgi:hypothetical protein